MKIKMLLLVILMTSLYSECESKYQYINGKKMASNCIWNKYIANKNKVTSKYVYDVNKPTFKDSIQYTSEYDFSRTYLVESYNKFDAVNRDDVGKGMSLGIIQFNSKYARELQKHLGIKTWMSTKVIKRKLRTSYSRKIQLKIFNRAFVTPILKFAYNNNITDPKVIEFLVDWRVNGMPKEYYNNIDEYTTIDELVSIRNARYLELHIGNPRRFTKRILKHWLKRSNAFLA